MLMKELLQLEDKMKKGGLHISQILQSEYQIVTLRMVVYNLLCIFMNCSKTKTKKILNNFKIMFAKTVKNLNKTS